MTPEQLARHEGGHASVAVLLGVPVFLVDVAGDAKSLGFVRHGAERVTDVDTALKRMLIALAGPLMGCESLEEVPSWPLDSAASTDEANLAALSDYLGLDERGYREVYLQALKLTLTAEFRRLHEAVAGMLDHTPRIDSELLDQLQAIATRGGSSWTI